jgi:hypothetical protein
MARPLPLWKPKTFTSAEAMLEEVRGLIRADSSTIRVIAAQTGVATTTVYNIVGGKTRWPRATTLFPLLDTLGYSISIQRKER